MSGTTSTVAETVSLLSDELMAEPVDPPDDSALTPIEKILVVDLRSPHSGEVLAAMKKLVALCYDGTADMSSQDRTTIHQIGGAAIRIAMRHWYDFPKIQAEGCRALFSISYKNVAFRKAAKDAGAIQAVTWAMKAFPDNPKVQLYACGAIHNLVRGVQDNKEYFVNTLDGIKLIIAAMKKFPHDAEAAAIFLWGAVQLVALGRRQEGCGEASRSLSCSCRCDGEPPRHEQEICEGNSQVGGSCIEVVVVDGVSANDVVFRSCAHALMLGNKHAKR